MEYGISAIWILLELFAFHFLWNALFERKRSKREYLSVLTLSWLAIFITSNIFSNSLLKWALTLFILIATSKYLFTREWYLHIIISALGFSLIAVTESTVTYGAIALMDTSFSALIQEKKLFIITGTIAQLISLFIAWLVCKVRKSKIHPGIQRQWVLLALPYPLTSLIAIGFIFYGFQWNPALSSEVFVFSMILAAANIMILGLINIMEKAAADAQKHALMRQQMEIQTESFIALEKNYRLQRQFVHNFKDQLQTIYGLLNQEQSEKAIEYIESLQGLQTTRILTVNSHHPIIDAVLNQKYQEAKEKYIDFQIQINNLSTIQLSTDVLVVVLSNLLDNAIEACCRLPDNRVIQFTLLAERSIFLSIRNTSPEVIIQDNTIPTTKDTKENHGYGLPTVQHLLHGLNAEFTYTYENHWFQFVAEIPIAAD